MQGLDLRLCRQFACAAAAAFLLTSAPVSAVETEDAVVLTIEDATAKVGEKAIVVAKITFREGFKVADGYRNRAGTFSAADDAVSFANPSVKGTIQNDNLVFKIAVTPTKAGAHAINGVLRFGFVNSVDGDYHLDIKSMPLIATVTGTE